MAYVFDAISRDEAERKIVRPGLLHICLLGFVPLSRCIASLFFHTDRKVFLSNVGKGGP